jgi:hypothetical protein
MKNNHKVVKVARRGTKKVGRGRGGGAVGILLLNCKNTHYGRPGCKSAVWKKAAVIPGRNPAEYRKDGMGNVIRFTHHGNTASEYGWHIDHRIPKTGAGGSDHLDNLVPLHWRENIRKSNKNAMNREYLQLKCEQREPYLNEQEKREITRAVYYKEHDVLPMKAGDVLMARELPFKAASWRPARIKSVCPVDDQVVVEWIGWNYEKILPYCSLLFDLPDTSR